MCVLCGKHGNFPDGFCQECQTLIYRNNDRLQYTKILQEVATLRTLPPKLRERIEEMLRHVPPFDGSKND